MGIRARMAEKMLARMPPARVAHAAFDRGAWVQAIEHGTRALAELDAALATAPELERMAGATERAELELLIGLAYKHIDDAGRAGPFLRGVYDRGLVDATCFTGDHVRTCLALTELETGAYAKLAPLLDDLLHHGSPAKQAFALRMRAVLTWRLTGDLGAASADLEQSVLADPPSEPGVHWHDAVYRAGFFLDAGRYDEARTWIVPAVEQQERLAPAVDDGTAADLGVTYGLYARILARTGDLDLARRYAADGARLLDPTKRYAHTYSHLGEAIIHTAADELDEAEAALTAGWSLANELGIIPTAIELLVARIELDRARGDGEAVERHRSQALDLCRMLGHVADQRHIAAL